MDKAELLENYLENPAYDFDTFEEFQMMCQDYLTQLLFEELKEDIHK